MAMEQPEQTGQARDSALTCYWHPEVETGLSCSRCGKRMCAQCLVQAPVGIRCRECGKAQPMPTYDVRPSNYTRAIGVAILLAIGGTILWILLDRVLGGLGAYGSVSEMLAIPFGYAAGELVSRAVNRKRSVLLSYIAGLVIVIAYLGSRVFNPGIDMFGVLFVVAGVFIAWQRLRR